MKKRIVIVDDHTSVREMLSTVISREGRYEVVGEAGSGLQALAVCQKQRPDLVVLDLILPELCGLEVMRRLRTEKTPPRLLVFSGAMCQKTIVEALRCKPEGFVEKSESLRSLLDGIRLVLEGFRYFTPFASAFLEDSFLSLGRALVLTDREHEVLQLTAEGRSCKEIASRLTIAVKTVENHRQHLMEKLNIHNVAGLTRYAIAEGILV